MLEGGFNSKGSRMAWLNGCEATTAPVSTDGGAHDGSQVRRHAAADR
jgi:hypothetical protein